MKIHEITMKNRCSTPTARLREASSALEAAGTPGVSLRRRGAFWGVFEGVFGVFGCFLGYFEGFLGFFMSFLGFY
jgi:hypothetical protein